MRDATAIRTTCACAPTRRSCCADTTESVMLEISRTALFGKLNPLAYKAIEGATVFCKLRGNPYVELQHWLYQILNAQDSDLHRIVHHYGIDASVLASDLLAALDRLPRGSTSVTDLSSWVENAV